MSQVKHNARGTLLQAYRREVGYRMDRAEERAGPEDVGEQALMRGLGTAFLCVRLGLSRPGNPRRYIEGGSPHLWRDILGAY